MLRMKHNLIINSRGKAGRRPHLTGIAAFAAAMTAPLRRNLDYHGLARNVFQVEQLPQGALPYYNKDIDVASAIGFNSETISQFKHHQFRITKNGKAGKNNNRVMMPSFEVFSSPTIKLDDVKRRRFNLIGRK